MRKIVRYLRKSLNSVSPIVANKVMYRILMKKKLNLKNPKTFNEKINWLKLYKYPNDSLVIKCSDKYEVRSYVESKGLSNILNELYGVYNNVEEIEWENLPQKFVLKCNHGCGYNIICDNKEILDVSESKKKIKDWMKEDFGKVSCEPHYSKIERKIICEKYLAENILDYKFFCFKGEPEFLYISRAVSGSHHGLKADFFNLEGVKMSFRRTDHESFDIEPAMMKNLAQAKEICRILSKDFEFVRVDLFEVEDKIYFSELTFTPSTGMMPLEPEKYDYNLGQKIEITI